MWDGLIGIRRRAHILPFEDSNCGRLFFDDLEI
jgi:hypothetical protein